MAPVCHLHGSRGGCTFYALRVCALLAICVDGRLRRGRTFLARSRGLQRSVASARAGWQQAPFASPAPGGVPQFTLSNYTIPDAAVPVLPTPVPVVAPAPAPPEPPPPKFPVIGTAECKELEDAIVVEPKASCRHTIFSESQDGCVCALVLPANINPLPNNLYDPFALAIVPDPDIPLPKSPPTVPPPSNPMQPYIAPLMAPECPFAKACSPSAGFDCVGFNSFGFSEAHQAPYSPAAAHLNQISCSYFIPPGATFTVPPKVVGMQKIRAKTAEAKTAYKEPFVVPEVYDATGTHIEGVPCAGKKIADSFEEFCDNQVQKLKVKCKTEYAAIMEEDKCKGAPAPPGFVPKSTLNEICPFQCGFKKGETKWPPLDPDHSGPAVWKPLD